MHWLQLLSYFLGGAFLANALPHLVTALAGKRLPTPFAKPPGRGLSSPTVNLGWGFANLGIGYVLVCRIGSFDLRSTAHASALGIGMILLGLHQAKHLGSLNGGEGPRLG